MAGLRRTAGWLLALLALGLFLAYPAGPARAATLFSDGLRGYFGFEKGVNPLTGLPADEPKLLERRPVLVKVSNYPPSVRPQAGLTSADLVFEYYIGEGMNRFLAVFYGQDVDRAGSLRSGRLVDGQLGSLYQGILAYGSADPRVDQRLRKELNERTVSHLQAGCPVICGGDTHTSPWVYVNTAELTRYAVRKGIPNDRPNLNGMVFNPAVPASDRYGLKIGMEFGPLDRSEWQYDPVVGLYLRWQEKDFDKQKLEPMVDQNNGLQVSAANVIVLFTDYTEYNPTLHDIDIWANAAGQRAIFFRDGVVQEGSWRTANQNMPIQFYDQWGLPVALKPGNTWLLLASLESEFEEVSPAFWEFGFQLE